MSLLGALLLALLGTAMARTPDTVMEQNTHTALASKAAQGPGTSTSLASKPLAQVKPANSLQSTTCCSTPGQLSSGETLPQGIPLYSVDGSVFIEITPAGVFALFNTETGSIIYQFLSTSTTNTPLSLTQQTDCNLVVHDSVGTTLFQSATTALLDNPEVTPPCRTVVAGAGGGFIAIIDSFSSGDQSDTVQYTRPLVGNGIMNEGQILPQNVRLYSPDGQVFINTQADGNLVLYNTTLKTEFGASAETAIADTDNGGLSAFAPFEFVMQTDCNAVIYKNSNTTGTIPANAIFETATYGQGTGCQLIVTSEQGGSMFVINSAQQILYELPRIPLNPLSTVPPPTTLPPATGFIPTTPGTLLANQDLPQNTPLYSMDGSSYLVMQGDGNLVLYSVSKVAQYGQGAVSALFNSGTEGTKAPGPYTLAMQGDCNVVIYDGNLATSGPFVYNAIYQLGTTNAGPNPCSLVVGPTSFSVIAANKAVVYNSASQG